MQKLEREFNEKVRRQVREKVFRASIEYFDDVRAFWGVADLVERLLVEMWFSTGSDTRRFVTRCISHWKDLPKDLFTDHEEIRLFIAGLDKRRRSQLLFLLTFHDEGLAGDSEGVKKLAASYTDLNYALVDAETRCEPAPEEFKQLAKLYLLDVKNSRLAEIPHFWWKEPEDDDPDENALGETSQG